MSKQDIVVTQNLCKQFRETKALEQVNLHIPKGAIYGLIGSNGAGKTTLMRILSHLSHPSSGEVKMDSKVKISAMIESPALHPYQTASQNLKYQMALVGQTRKTVDDYLDLVHLKNTRKLVGNYSLGMRQRLGIAMALVSEPDFLILDEPLNGLDPEGMRDMEQIIRTLNEEYQMTILISSHLLSQLQKVATHYGFIQHGELVKEFQAEELEQTDLEELYFTYGGAEHA